MKEKKKTIKYSWIAQDRNGDIWAYTHKPTLYEVNWFLYPSDSSKSYELLFNGLEIDETDSWQKSLRRYWGLKGILTRLIIWWIR